MTGITLLDGGLGQEIVRRSGDRATPLWSTAVMVEHPGVVQQVHEAFFAAGATVATTNTYAVHRDRLVRAGLEDRFEEVLLLAAHEATAARDAHGSGRIAGSLGPLGASYRPELCPPPAEAAPLYAEVAQILAPHVDFFICETMASVDQAEGAMRGAKQAGKPVWLSLTVTDEDGTRLRSGEPLDAIAAVVERHEPAALLLNCSVPEVMAKGLDVLKGFGKPFGALANGFTRISEDFLKDNSTVDALEQRTDLTPEAHADFVMGWISNGATIAGGCCEIGPAHISELARRLRAAGHRIE